MASISGLPRPQTASRRRSSARPTTSVLLTRGSDDISILTKGTAGVRDRSFARSGKSDFVRHIRQKEAAILQEIERLRAESAAMERDKAKFPSLESKRDKLTVAVVELEGQLTDYNLAMDRANMHVLPSELDDANAALAKTNRKLADELARAYSDVETQEQNVDSLQEQLQATFLDIEKRVREEGDQEQLKRFHSLKTLVDDLQEQKKRREEEIRAIDRQLLELEDSAKGQRHREYEALSTKAAQLESDIGSLSEETKALELPISEAREFLMAATEEKERSISACDAEFEQLDLNIENLLTLRDNLLSELTSIELEQLGGTSSSFASKGLEDTDNLSFYQERIAQMQSKQATLKASIDRLRGQVDPSSKRDFHDHQVFSVGELQALEERRMQLEDELVKYDDLVRLQARSDQAKAALKKRKDELTEKIAQTKPIVAELSAASEANKAKLESDENWSSLQQMQKKQTDQEREIESLEEFVEVKGRECEYENMKSGCLALARSLNEELVGGLQ